MIWHVVKLHGLPEYQRTLSVMHVAFIDPKLDVKFVIRWKIEHLWEK